MDTIGFRIAQKRRQKGLTQEALAERLGVSPQAVSKWENDQSCPDISLLPALAGALGCTVDELLTGKINEVSLLPESQRKRLDELTLHIYIHSSDGETVKVNLPMPVVKLGLKMGVDIGIHSGRSSGADPLKNVDLNRILELVENGTIGKLVEVATPDGDTIEIVVE